MGTAVLQTPLCVLILPGVKLSTGVLFRGLSMVLSLLHGLSGIEGRDSNQAGSVGINMQLILVLTPKGDTMQGGRYGKSTL